MGFFPGRRAPQAEITARVQPEFLVGLEKMAHVPVYFSVRFGSGFFLVGRIGNIGLGGPCSGLDLI